VGVPTLEAFDSDVNVAFHRGEARPGDRHEMARMTPPLTWRGFGASMPTGDARMPTGDASRR